MTAYRQWSQPTDSRVSIDSWPGGPVVGLGKAGSTNVSSWNPPNLSRTHLLASTEVRICSRCHKEKWEDEQSGYQLFSCLEGLSRTFVLLETKWCVLVVVAVHLTV